MIIGLTTGTFDLFHAGHLNLLRAARRRCDYLIVGVHSDAQVKKHKNKKPLMPARERLAIVRAIKYVDKVFLNTSYYISQEHHKKHRFDKYFSGSDAVLQRGAHVAAQRELFNSLGVEYVFIESLMHVSSTILKAKARTPG